VINQDCKDLLEYLSNHYGEKEIPKCAESLCEKAPERSFSLLYRCDNLSELSKSIIKRFAETCGIDIDNAPLHTCSDIPSEFCSKECPYYFRRQVSKALSCIEKIYMYEEKDDIIYEVWLDGTPLEIKASAFQRGVQVLLLRAGLRVGEAIFLPSFKKKTREKVLEIVLDHLHKNAEKLSKTNETIRIRFSHIGETDRLLRVFFKDKEKTYIWTPKWSDVRQLYERAVLFELVHHGLKTGEAKKFHRHCRRICRILKHTIRPEVNLQDRNKQESK